MKPTFFLLSVLVFMYVPPAISAEKCNVALQKKSSDMFGSSEQLKLLQKKIKKDKCSQLKIFWTVKDPSGLSLDKLILLDLDGNGSMLRWTKISTTKPSYEFWHGFYRDDLLKDDPNDGFDLPNYTTTLSPSEHKMMSDLVAKMTAS